MSNSKIWSRSSLNEQELISFDTASFFAKDSYKSQNGRLLPPNAFFNFPKLQIQILQFMNIEEIREYCIAKPGATEGFPFNDTAF